MNALEIIYLIGAAAVGLLAGMIVELSIDTQTIADLKASIHKLRLENEQLKRQPEVIEIVDNRVENEEYRDYFKPF